jgi:hypothetical protein
MSAFLVNIDFEETLMLDHYKPVIKLNSEFEYVFFFQRKEYEAKLFSLTSFEEDYLEYIKSKNIKLPQIVTKSSDYKLWWGNRNLLELKRKIISKSYAHKLGKRLGLTPSDSCIVHSIEEIENFFRKHGDLLLRSNRNFSGRGHLFVSDWDKDKGKITKKIKEGELVCDSLRKRVLDIGVSMNLDNNEFYLVQNFNDKLGSFKGGQYHQSIKTLKVKYDFINVEQLEKNIFIIMKSLKEEGCTGEVQVDMYYYETNNNIKLNPLVEINWRKSMGGMVKSLYEKNNSNGSWLIIPRKKILTKLSFRNIDELFKDKILVTSPLSKMFFSFYLIGKTKKEQQENLESFLSYLQCEKYLKFYLNFL